MRYFYKVIQYVWKVIFDIRDNFMKINSKTIFFILFPVENGKKNKDLFWKKLTQE